MAQPTFAPAARRGTPQRAAHFCGRLRYSSETAVDGNRAEEAPHSQRVGESESLTSATALTALTAGVMNPRPARIMRYEVKELGLGERPRLPGLSGWLQAKANDTCPLDEQAPFLIPGALIPL
jgi:hypothetical protein